jgi:hypothetical protein
MFLYHQVKQMVCSCRYRSEIPMLLSMRIKSTKVDLRCFKNLKFEIKKPLLLIETDLCVHYYANPSKMEHVTPINQTQIHMGRY